MDKIQKNFCKALKKYKDLHYNYRGGVNDLAEKLNLTQGHFSNVLAGRKCPGELWRREVAEKIGMNYDDMIGIKNGESKNIPKKIISIDPAVEFLNECIQEAGVGDHLNDRQKQALLKIIRDELKSAEEKAKKDIKKYLTVLKG